MEVAAINLSRRYEAQLLAQNKLCQRKGKIVCACRRGQCRQRSRGRPLSHTTSPSPPTKAIPAVVITGFLGTGKTTLVQHLLRAG